MDDHRPETSVDRKEFLRRTGALGIAGAAALGFPLLETRIAGASPLLPPRDVIAAGGGATVKIGHIDGFSGVYAAASQSQQHGMEVAVAEAMKKNNRIKYEIIKGDDANKPATGTTEAKRLISQEKVDVLTGCLSSGVGLAVSATCAENNTFFLAVGTHDTNITGPESASRDVPPDLLERDARERGRSGAAQEGQEVVLPGRRLRVRHRRRTSASRRSCSRRAAQEVGVDLHPLGQTDYSSYLTKARNTDADVLVFSNYGPDCQNATKAAVQLGLNKKMTFGGILCGNDVAIGMPVDDLVGSLWGYVWGPEAGGDAMQRLQRAQARRERGRLAPVPRLHGRREHHQPRQRTPARPATEKVVEAFENYHYDAAKKSGAYFRKCDHQAVQQTYAGEIVAKNKRRSPNEFFTIASTVGGDYAAETCSNPDSAAAEKIITSREDRPARRLHGRLHQVASPNITNRTAAAQAAAVSFGRAGRFVWTARGESRTTMTAMTLVELVCRGADHRAAVTDPDGRRARLREPVQRRRRARLGARRARRRARRTRRERAAAGRELRRGADRRGRDPRARSRRFPPVVDEPSARAALRARGARVLLGAGVGRSRPGVRAAAAALRIPIVRLGFDERGLALIDGDHVYDAHDRIAEPSDVAFVPLERRAADARGAGRRGGRPGARRAARARSANKALPRAA